MDRAQVCELLYCSEASNHQQGHIMGNWVIVGTAPYLGYGQDVQ